MPRVGEQKTTKVVSRCKECGEKESFTIPHSGLRKMGRGMPMREALPGLEDWQYHVLAKHQCRACRKKAGTRQESDALGKVARPTNGAEVTNR
jgi:hypothetical protein